MIGRLPRPRRNRNSGKAKRAAWYVRLNRTLRRKRVAYARIGVAQAMKALQMEIDRMEHLAAAHRVPIEPMAPLPPIPLLPGQLWVDHLEAMGPLKNAVIVRPTVQNIEPEANPC